MLNLEELKVMDMPGLEGMDVDPAPALELIKVDSNYEEQNRDIKSDYELVRENLHYQSQMLLDASKIFIESAKNADSPRFMEAFSTLMGQMTATNREILKVHKEMKEITQKDKTEQVDMNINATNNTTNVYLSTSDLLDQMGGSQDAIEGEIVEDEYD